MNQQVEKWEKWLEVLYKNFAEVFFNRHIFWEVQAIIRNNPNLENYKPNWFNVFLGQAYFDYAVSAIRRQVRHHRSSISLVGLLEKIIQTPSVLSRERFVERFVYLHPGGEQRANDLFDEKFAGECADHIDAIIVCQDLCKLKALSRTVEEFADTRVSHLDEKIIKKGLKGSPPFKALDDCIDYLAELIQKYYLLFKGKKLGGDLSVDFTDDWQGIFDQPWIVPDASDTSM